MPLLASALLAHKFEVHSHGNCKLIIVNDCSAGSATHCLEGSALKLERVAALLATASALSWAQQEKEGNKKKAMTARSKRACMS